MGQVYNFNPGIESERSAFIATASRSGNTSPAYQLSLLRTVEVCQKEGINVQWCLLTGNCHVDDARNYLVRDFLDSACTDLFFIDADVGWQTEDFVKMMQAEQDVTAGIYPKKRDEAEYPVKLTPGENWTDQNGWMEVDKVPTGFLRIRRHVLQSMYDNEPRKFNSEKQQYRTPQAILFERTYESGTRISGDYSWCKRYRDQGGKIYVNPEMRFFHSGEKEWQGKLGHHLRKKNNLLESYIIGLLRKIENGAYQESDFLELYEAWDNVWSSDPNLLMTTALILEETEGNVLDIGSGLSTLVIAAIAKRRGLSVVSLEHDPGWYNTIQHFLTSLCYNIEHIYAPLEAGWYGYRPNRDFNFVLIDGPPAVFGRDGVRTIENNLAEKCVVLADDFDHVNVQLQGVKFKSLDRFAFGVKQ